MTGILDRLVDDLAQADEQVRQAGQAHLDGDNERALELITEAAFLLNDVRADLGREFADPEPRR